MQHDLLSNITATIGGAIAWLTGEAGKQWLAGGAGGLLRWALAGRTGAFWSWLWSGIAQTFGGALTAYYGWPIVLRIIETFTGDLGAPGLDPQSIATASFIAGMLGISAAKIIMAAFDKRGAQLLDQKLGGGSNGNS